MQLAGFSVSEADAIKLLGTQADARKIPELHKALSELRSNDPNYVTNPEKILDKIIGAGLENNFGRALEPHVAAGIKTDNPFIPQTQNMLQLYHGAFNPKATHPGTPKDPVTTTRYANNGEEALQASQHRYFSDLKGRKTAYMSSHSAAECGLNEEMKQFANLFGTTDQKTKANLIELAGNVGAGQLKSLLGELDKYNTDGDSRKEGQPSLANSNVLSSSNNNPSAQVKKALDRSIAESGPSFWNRFNIGNQTINGLTPELAIRMGQDPQQMVAYLTERRKTTTAANADKNPASAAAGNTAPDSAKQPANPATPTVAKTPPAVPAAATPPTAPTAAAPTQAPPAKPVAAAHAVPPKPRAPAAKTDQASHKPQAKAQTPATDAPTPTLPEPPLSMPVATTKPAQIDTPNAPAANEEKFESSWNDKGYDPTSPYNNAPSSTQNSNPPAANGGWNNARNNYLDDHPTTPPRQSLRAETPPTGPTNKPQDSGYDPKSKSVRFFGASMGDKPTPKYNERIITMDN